MEENELLQKIETLTTQFADRMKSSVTKDELESLKAAAKEETKQLIESVKASITED